MVLTFFLAFAARGFICILSNPPPYGNGKFRVGGGLRVATFLCRPLTNQKILGTDWLCASQKMTIKKISAERYCIYGCGCVAVKEYRPASDGALILTVGQIAVFKCPEHR